MKESTFKKILGTLALTLVSLVMVGCSGKNPVAPDSGIPASNAVSATAPLATPSVTATPVATVNIPDPNLWRPCRMC